jgi:hypothetical protein
VIELPDASPASRALLDQALRRPGRVTMIIVASAGSGAPIAALARTAEAKNPSRQVVWVKNARLLTPEEQNMFTDDGRAAVCVLPMRGPPAKLLTAEDAEDATELELAFLAGQQG